MTPDLLTGLDINALIVGLMSSTAIIFWLDTVDNIPKAASAVFFSALLSGYGAPVATAYLIVKFTSLAPAADALPLFAAVIIGGSVTWGLPILINFIRTKWGGPNA